MSRFSTALSALTRSDRPTPTSSPSGVRARLNGSLVLGALFLLIAAPCFEAQASSHPPNRHKVERVLPAEQEIEGDTVEWRLEFTIDVQISSANAFYLKKVEFEPPAGNRRWDSGIVTYSKHNNSNKVYDVKFTNFGGREGVLAFGIDSQYITGNGQNASYGWSYRTSDVRDIVHNAHYLVDNIHPKPTITGIPEEMKTMSHQVTFTFHEDVTGFALDDITSDNGTFSNFRKTSDRVYTADLTLARKDSVTVSIRANAAEDGRGNDSLASSFSATFDTTSPRVTSIERQDPTDYRTDANTLKWRVIFNEDVTGVAAEDFTVSGTTAGLSVNTSSGRQIDVTARGGDLENLDGVVRLGFKDGYTVTDVAGNALTNPTPTGSIKDSYSLDNTAPSVVSILRTTSNNTTPQKYETNAGSVWWRVTFSERVTGVEYLDFSLSGRDSVTGKTLFGGTGAWEVENSGGTQYRVHASGGDVPSFNGVMTLNLKTSHGIKDQYNRPLTSRTPTEVNENSFLLDHIRPTVTISGVPPVADGVFTATLRFSEAVEDFDVADINAANATLSSFTATTEGQEWTVEVTPTADYQLEVAKDVARDAAGNGNAANDGSGASGTYGGVTVSPESLAMDEGSSRPFTVVLDVAPTGDVAVALTSDNEDVTLDNETLTFTTTNWSSAQTVSVSAAEDDADAAADFATITVNPSGGGYDAVVDETVDVTVTDNDAPGAGMTVSPQSLALSEGSSGSFRVVLNAAPTGDVTVALTSNNAAVAPGPGTLTFTTANWNVAQTVTVRALEDGDATAESATVTVDASGGGYDAVAYETVAVTVTDNDAPGAGMTVSPESLTILEGSSGSFTVVLNAAPTGDVAVPVSSDHGAVTVSPAELTFTPSDWNVARTVTVTAAEDEDEEDENAMLDLDPSGGGYDGLTEGVVLVTVSDGDLSGAGLTMAPASLTIAEGSSASFTLALAALPKGPVTVALSSDHGDVAAEPASLTFTPSDWNSAQTVTVSAAKDDDAANESATLTVDPSGGGYDNLADGSLPVTVTDSDAPFAGLRVEPASLTVREGSSARFAVALDAVPKGAVTVAIGADRPGVALDPASLTFTPSNWNAAQMVTVRTIADGDGEDERVTLTVDPSGGGYDAVPPRTVAVLAEDGVAPEAERRLAEPALVDVALDTLSGMSAALQGRFGGCDTAVTLGGETVRAGGAEARDRRTGERRPTPGEALGKSAFRWSAGCDGASDRRWTVWGHGDLAHFSGGLTQGRYEGALRTAWLGVDRYVRENLVAGAALSRGEGRIEFGRFSLADETAELLTRLTVGWPYLRVETRGGGALQLVLGAGRGAAEYRRVGQRTEKAKLEALLASVGGEAPLWRGGGVSLRARGGLEAAQVKTGGGASGVLGGLRAEGRRLRAGVEAEHSAFRLGTLALAPRGAAAVAQDAGDGLAGTGLELSAGLRIATSDPRFGFSASARWLALHSAERRRNWGGGVEAVWKAAPDGRGLSLSLAPTWGLQGEGALQGPDIFASLEERAGGGAALASRLGYGLATPGGGLLTPFVELALGERDTRRLATGAEFEWRPDLAATLTGERRDAKDRPSELRFGLQLRLRF